MSVGKSIARIHAKFIELRSHRQRDNPARADYGKQKYHIPCHRSVSENLQDEFSTSNTIPPTVLKSPTLSRCQGNSISQEIRLQILKEKTKDLQDALHKQ